METRVEEKPAALGPLPCTEQGQRAKKRGRPMSSSSLDSPAFQLQKHTHPFLCHAGFHTLTQL